MPKQLTTHNASITTVAVEVKALTISGKQVTLSVFRQLPEAPLLAEDCSLNGMPWGVVNYHPDKCGDAEEHLHVVWQRGEELLRSAVYTPQFGQHFTSLAGAYAETLIAAGRRLFDDRPIPVGSLGCGRPDYVGAPAHVSFRWNGVRFYGQISPAASAAFRGDVSALKELQERIGTASGDDLLSSLPADAYRSAWAEIQRLPQLFIAV